MPAGYIKRVQFKWIDRILAKSKKETKEIKSLTSDNWLSLSYTSSSSINLSNSGGGFSLFPVLARFFDWLPLLGFSACFDALEDIDLPPLKPRELFSLLVSTLCSVSSRLATCVH